MLWSLGGLALATPVAVTWWSGRTPDHDAVKLTVEEAFARAQDGSLTLIDIRTPNEWRTTGVPLSGQPLDMRRADFIAALDEITGGSRDAPIALICARGVRSARMTLALQDAGYSQIIDVPEGMLGSGAGPGWLETGLPVSQWAGSSEGSE
ncbi:rhodanese-like domain-containing protein [Phaeobacter sp.]|uniref:rhodanese-like domain-containing protein n=1 Tax=Phaeobacter sp. TaxID=1902409 RepID=UPI0025CF729B|nr:rhodanese-like domain-containing protein [Phaeobacter sp.]